MHMAPLQEPEQTVWGVYQRFAEKVSERVLDGFFVPHEGRPKALPETWPDDAEVVRYTCPSGVLLFRAGAWANYGYSDEDLFRQAVKKRRVMCKTAAGAISLGDARYVAGTPRRVILQLEGQPVFNTFFAVDDTDADQITDMLRLFVENAQFFRATGAFGAALAASRIFDVKHIKDMLAHVHPRWRATLIILAALGTLCVVACGAALFRIVPSWIIPVAIAAFPAAAITSVVLIQAQHRQRIATE